MLPHSAVFGISNNNVPAVHVVTIPSWDAYAGTASYNKYNDYTAKEVNQCDDAADNFKVLARRNGIKVSRPAEDTEGSRDSIANLSPSAEEFVPRHRPQTLTNNLQLESSSMIVSSPVNEDNKLLAMFQEVLNERNQQVKILKDCIKREGEDSKTTISSLTETNNVLKKEVTTLQSDIAMLRERNSILSEEVAALTERLIQSEESKARLECQVATLTNKLQEKENSEDGDRTMAVALFDKLSQSEAEKKRAWNAVENLSQKCNQILEDNERKETDLTLMKEKIEKAVLDKECAETKAKRLEDDICQHKCDKERAETETKVLAAELQQNKLEKDRINEEMSNLICELNKCRSENERTKERNEKEFDHSTAEMLSFEKISSPDKKMDRLDMIDILDDGNDNWTVVQRKSKASKSTKMSQPCKAPKKMPAKRSQSFDDTLLGSRNGFLSGDRICSQKEKKTIPPLMGDDCHQLKIHSDLNSNTQNFGLGSEELRKDSITANLDAEGLDAVDLTKPSTKQGKPNELLTTTNVESSQGINSATKTATIKEPFMSEESTISSNSSHQALSTINGATFDPKMSTDSLISKMDPLTEQLDLGQQNIALPNGIEKCFSQPMFDPTFIDMPLLQTLLQPLGQSIPAPVLKTNPLSFASGALPGSRHLTSHQISPHLTSRLKDQNKSSKKQEKEKQDLSSFDVLMNRLTERFPSKTRSELMMLLKLAKVSFGDQGFRRKKTEEICQRVGEIIDSEKKEDKVAQICSICQEDMENEETILKCGHSFHVKCLKEWIKTDRTCPLCRSHALTEDEFPSLITT